MTQQKMNLKKFFHQKLRLLRAMFSSKETAIVYEPKYSEDGIASVHVPYFLKDERFLRAYKAGKMTKSWGKAELNWRVHVALGLAASALKVKGDFVECGVNYGGNCKAQLDYLPELSTRRYFLIDTYCGIPPESIDKDEAALGVTVKDYSYSYDKVRLLFENENNVVLVKGIVPEVLKTQKFSSLAFIHLDMNVGRTELEAAEILWPFLNKGGVLLLDDVCFSEKYIKTAEYFLKFSERNKTSLIFLPTGQGFLIK
jgi:O-methyltransferase